MELDRIKVLLERLSQRFNPAEADELRREMDAAKQEIAALQEVQRRQANEDASAKWARPDIDGEQAH